MLKLNAVDEKDIDDIRCQCGTLQHVGCSGLISMAASRWQVPRHVMTATYILFSRSTGLLVHLAWPSRSSSSIRACQWLMHNGMMYACWHQPVNQAQGLLQRVVLMHAMVCMPVDC